MKILLSLLTPLAPALAPVAPVAAAPDPAVWPLTPRPPVVRGFDLPAKPWLPGHRGVDLSGSPGQSVRAATAGTITYAGQLAGRGVIVVTTGVRRTTYEPVVAGVPVGTSVTPGTVIGRLSAAGSHCAPATCLHWGLVQGKQYLNPLTLLPDRPVRLLPLTAASMPPNAHPPQPADVPARQADLPGDAGRAPRLATAQAGGSGQRSARVATRPAADVPAPRPRGERVAAAVVATAAALTLAAGLMIRRH
ncbi:MULTISPECIES: M23 family metallopeptidase [unclassified Kribbella]|uniref:M23 family metallopeptidase n=1 Tax=unclassified Kribbella TaxID=2644121 RepID=UPI00340AF64B